MPTAFVASSVASLLNIFLIALVVSAARLEHHGTDYESQSFATTQNGLYKLSTFVPPEHGTRDLSGFQSSWSFSVDDTTKGFKQPVEGFGAAITDTAVVLFRQLSPIQQKNLLDELFSSSGIALGLMRHTIGSSDMTPLGESYTFHNQSADIELENFSLGSLGNEMLNMIQRSKLVNPRMKLVGSSWSAPGWMKLNGMQHGSTVRNNLNMNFASCYASYFVKYLQTYSAVGIDAITIQNEPLNSQDGYPTMYMAASQAAELINEYIRPSFQAAGLNTEIWAYDHNTDVPAYPQQVIDQSNGYVKSVAWHCYATNADWTVLSRFHETNPRVKQYMTECWTSPEAPWENLIDFTMGPLQNWASGVIAWTLASDLTYGPHLPGGCKTCRGLIQIVDHNTYIKTPDFYLLGQFSKFVAVGAKILTTTGSWDYGNDQKFQAVSFLNPDGTRVVVIQNNFKNEVFVTISFSKDIWSGPVLANSLTTWILPTLPDKELGREKLSEKSAGKLGNSIKTSYGSKLSSLLKLTKFSAS